ncbi:MAG: hypothetical protein H6659_05620 [Ardenticatenaceae bacterium]|nr:hypothetical protein [Ardenticatenaceae bacterium]
MNKRVLQFAFLSLIVSMAFSTSAFAGTFRSPAKDTMCSAEAGTWCANGYGVQAVSSGIYACIPDQVGFVGWDLSSVTETIGSAQVSLTTYDVSGAPQPPTGLVFELFVPASQDWTESIDQASPGSSGAILASTTIALANGSEPQTVVFGGSSKPTDAATLGAYFESIKTTGPATVGVRISGGCLLGTVVAFNDREDTGNLPGGAAATEANLILFSPTAVSVSSLSASREMNNVSAFVAIGLVSLSGIAAGSGLLKLRKRRQGID